MAPALTNGPVNRRCSDFIGARVELAREITSRAGIVFPAGTRMTVTQTWRGTFSLCIGFASPFSLNGVSRYSFRPVEGGTSGDVCYPCRSLFRIYAFNGNTSEPCPVCGRAALGGE